MSPDACNMNIEKEIIMGRGSTAQMSKSHRLRGLRVARERAYDELILPPDPAPGRGTSSCVGGNMVLMPELKIN